MRKDSAQFCLAQLLTVQGASPNLSRNTPAMPLPEAHFGGFFVPEGRV